MSAAEIARRLKSTKENGQLDLSCLGLSVLPVLSVSFPVLEVDLNHNQLSAFPVQLYALGRDLVKIDLSNNRITDLSDVNWRAFPALRQLHVARNPQLTALPAALFALPTLAGVHADHCALEALPAATGQCRSLTVLDVRYNRIRKLPRSLSALPDLGVLAVEGNPLQPTLMRLRHNTSALLGHLAAQPPSPGSAASASAAPDSGRALLTERTASQPPAACAPATAVPAAATTAAAAAAVAAPKPALASRGLVDLTQCDSYRALQAAVRAQLHVPAGRAFRVRYSEEGQPGWTPVDGDAAVRRYHALIRSGRPTQLSVDLL